MAGPDASAAVTLHATSVAVGARGVLILGRSGAGKSSLALQMIALGAVLIADDRTIATPGPRGLHLDAPPAISGRIEARGMGLLALPRTTATAALVVDLDTPETERLPPAREVVIAGATLRLQRRLDSPAFASMLILHLSAEPPV